MSSKFHVFGKHDFYSIIVYMQYNTSKIVEEFRIQDYLLVATLFCPRLSFHEFVLAS
jgi:hypothetical protein